LLLVLGVDVGSRPDDANRCEAKVHQASRAEQGAV